MPPAAPLTPADRFAAIIDGLCRAVAESGGRRLLAGPLVLLIWSRLRRFAVRFAALADRIAAGRHRRYLARRRPPWTARRRVTPALPRGPAWLSRLVPQANGYGSQLQYLLAEPEMAALIAAAPQAARILRPLCRMLGIRPPPGLLAPRPAPAAAAPARAEAPGRAPPAATPSDPPRPAAPAPDAPVRACGPPAPA